MSTSESVQSQLNQYFFDLHNFALEYGLKLGADWDIEQVNLEGKKSLERRYQLTLSNKVLPEHAPELFRLMQLKLHPDTQQLSHQIDEKSSQGEYLIAFHKERLKR